eukprot:CAMPEP_0176268430 /NCGR_PEP_ID=MMETSP0121_2-20121125/43668_2 /TAXON_ID=160619 /ORGANISM="Kryptoperidinium foliaceum, Strain CCMP 1326" /LENGTH=253 /DNA_ID=CAMNT_0017608519 /DNA_START=87 /DNA_END=847 /DNA_ORIENTATION=-
MAAKLPSIDEQPHEAGEATAGAARGELAEAGHVLDDLVVQPQDLVNDFPANRTQARGPPPLDVAKHAAHTLWPQSNAALGRFTKQTGHVGAPGGAGSAELAGGAGGCLAAPWRVTLAIDSANEAAAVATAGAKTREGRSTATRSRRSSEVLKAPADSEDLGHYLRAQLQNEEQTATESDVDVVVDDQQHRQCDRQDTGRLVSCLAKGEQDVPHAELRSKQRCLQATQALPSSERLLATSACQGLADADNRMVD